MRRPELTELKWFVQFNTVGSVILSHTYLIASCSQLFFYWSHPWAIPFFPIQEIQGGDINFYVLILNLFLFYLKNKLSRRKKNSDVVCDIPHSWHVKTSVFKYTLIKSLSISVAMLV